jgi:hypothetical protein
MASDMWRPVRQLSVNPDESPGMRRAHGPGVTHRLEIRKQDGTVVFELQGVLDRAAMASLRASLEFARANGASARVVLRAGTEVERSCLPELRALDAELVAESPYLASWLAS